MNARVLQLPAAGRLLVCTDIQGNLRDFSRMIEIFDQEGPDAHLVFTGDLVHGPDPETEERWPSFLGTPYRDASPEVIEAFLAARDRAPGRVHALLGNHEHAHIGGPVVAKFYPDEAAALEDRLDADGVERLRETFRAFPLVAVAPCGVVLLHAAPSAPVEGPDTLRDLDLSGYDDLRFPEFVRVPVLGPLLWSRMATDAQAERFVQAFGAELAIYGHDIVREGYAADGPRMLCLSTSFGVQDPLKTYVSLDLSARYTSTADLRPDHELLPLW